MQKPLVVDLDGTLIKTDLLAESASAYLVQKPMCFLKLIGWLCKGRSVLKAKLAGSVSFDPAVLPYNQELLAYLKEEKAKGRTLVLATASAEKFANVIAEYLDLFDFVLGSTEKKNLKGQNKRDVLLECYGKKGFDYIGNDKCDLPIWEVADKSYVVGEKRRLIKSVQHSVRIERVFKENKASAVFSVFKAMRTYQWVKNLLLFVPILASHSYTNTSYVYHSIIAFIVFSLVSSSVYILNDIIDIDDDRQHPKKKKRPFASGQLSLFAGWFLWPLLLLVGFSLAYSYLTLLFVGVLLAYFLLTLCYSLYLKRQPLIDVITLAMLYTIRILAGVAAVEITTSFWLLSFSVFIFLSLAFIKRYSELKLTSKTEGNKTLPGRGYSVEDLNGVSIMGTSSGYISVLVLALYIQDPQTAKLYNSPEYIWLACPLLLYWISRMWMVSYQGKMHDDPIVYAIKDRASWIVVFLFIISFFLAKFF